MTTITDTRYAAAAAAEERELAVDSLDIRHAIIGDGLVLTHSADHRPVIHTLGGGRARLLGVFGDAAAALAALDELEQA